MNTNSAEVYQQKSKSIKRIQDPLSNSFVQGFLSSKRVMVEQKQESNDKINSSPQQSCDENDNVKLFIDVFTLTISLIIDTS